MSDEPFLELDSVRKRFGDQPVLESTDLALREDEFFTLLGPSGCGKTTLLRILAGLEQPDAGAVRLRGRDLGAVPPERRPFNTVFQSYALFPHMTVEANVAYGLRAAGVAVEEQRGRVEAMLDLVHMLPSRGRPVTVLSGGQQQRVALARALVNEPEVLLLDEPLAALDLQLRKGLQEELRALQVRVGTTFVYVTHDQDEALALADRIGVMRGGRVVQIGSPQEIYERPETRFVAEFIGDANLLPCSVLEDGDGVATARLPWGSAVPLGRYGPVRFASGASALAVVRPEQVLLAADGKLGEGLVEDVRFLGGHARVDVRLPDGTLVRARAAPGAVVETGTYARLGLQPGAGAVVPADGDD